MAPDLIVGLVSVIAGALLLILHIVNRDDPL